MLHLYFINNHTHSDQYVCTLFYVPIFAESIFSFAANVSFRPEQEIRKSSTSYTEMFRSSSGNVTVAKLWSQ